MYISTDINFHKIIRYAIAQFSLEYNNEFDLVYIV